MPGSQLKIDALVLRGNAHGSRFTYPLPEADEVTIGRGAEADVRIALSEASRRHAKLRVTSSGIQICDLGSTNGTIIRRNRLAPNTWVDIEVGEPFRFGEQLVVLQPRQDDRACERLTGADAFMGRVHTELATFERTDRPFAVATFAGVEQGDWIDTLAAILSSNDVVGTLGEATIALLLIGRTPEAVSRLVLEVTACMERHNSPPIVRCSYCPETGTTLEKLLPSTVPSAEVGETVRPAVLVQRGGPMERVLEIVGQVAPTSTSVLVFGATGTGKDVLARTIHERSKRRNGPFVALNCAALPDNLLESELFGYERGAFTGAVGAKPGQFEIANGGTLFLDEIGDMPILAQAKLLRVLEERAVLRLGGTKPIAVDVRIVAATNLDLRARIEEGHFRADLFFRLNGLSIKLPLLRDRKDEIPPLVSLFASRAAAGLRRSPPLVAPEALALLVEYDWPGNIRELRSVVERAVLLATHGFIHAGHLPEELLPKGAAASGTFEVPPMTGHQPTLPEFDEEESTTAAEGGDARAEQGPSGAPWSLDELVSLLQKHQLKPGLLTRELVIHALDRCSGNQTEAAKLLGVSRRTIVGRIKRYGIVWRRDRGDGN